MLASLLSELRRRLQRRAPKPASPDTPGRERHVEPVPGRPGWVRISVLGSDFTLPDHPWWPTFAADWEAQTLLTYQRFVHPGDVVVDAGTWIGPTLMFAAARGAARVLAIEPNPACLPWLDALRAQQPPLATRIVHCPTGVFAREARAEFGIPKAELTARASASLLGRGTTIEVAPLPTLMQRHDFAEPDFLKIDVEGAEFTLAPQLEALAAQRSIRILLSLHPPLAPADFGHAPLLRALRAFDAYDAGLAPITHAEVERRVASPERMPPWGTEFGNFFEVMLAPRGEPLDRMR